MKLSLLAILVLFASYAYGDFHNAKEQESSQHMIVLSQTFGFSVLPIRAHEYPFAYHSITLSLYFSL